MPDTANDATATHVPVALALKYEPGQVPRVIARGRGAVASAIIAKARESGILIEEDPVLAEALASVDVDTEIPVELFQAVAKVIAFVLATRASLPKA